MSGLRSLVDPKTKVVTSPSAPGSSKKHLLSPSDSSGENTPWTSQSVPSSIHLILPAPVPRATHFAITFQGGFSGTSLMVYVATKAKEGSATVQLGLIMGKRVFPEDKSSRQVFEIPYPSNCLIPPYSSALPKAMTSSTDLPNSDGIQIQTERPPNPGGADPAPLPDAARDRLPAGYQPFSAAATSRSAAAGANGDGDKESLNSTYSTESATVAGRLAAGWTVPELTELKLEFERSSDNQGRVTVYSVEILGE